MSVRVMSWAAGSIAAVASILALSATALADDPGDPTIAAAGDIA